MSKTGVKHGEQPGADKLHSFDYLWEQRWVHFKSEREIGEGLGVTHPAVGYWLKKYGIGGRVHPYIEDPDILHDLFIRRDMTLMELSERFNVDKSTIIERCKEYGISKPVHRRNAKGVRWAIPFIREKYEQEQWTVEKIAEALDLAGIARVLAVMEQYGVERRSHSWYSGERSQLYIHGSPTVVEYGESWTEWRNKAREAAGYSCERCGVDESDLHRQLAVHHITPVRMFNEVEEAHYMDNLMALCDPCHATVEHWPVNPIHYG